MLKTGTRSELYYCIRPPLLLLLPVTRLLLLDQKLTVDESETACFPLIVAEVSWLVCGHSKRLCSRSGDGASGGPA